MKKQLLLGSITALMLSSGLHANWDGAYAEWDNNNYYDGYDNCCCPESKILVEAEFLYWTPGTYFPFANNTYTTPGLPVTSTTAPFANVVNTVDEPYVRISEKWSPGVRVGLGWQTCDGWQIWGKWTGYSNYARRVITSRPPIAPPVTGPTLANGALVTPIGSGFFDTDTVGTSVTAAYKLNYNVADLVLAKELRPECNLVLVPYAGVRATFINQRQSAYFTGAPLAESASRAVPAGFAPGNFRYHQESYFVGPRIGLGAEWGDWCGFSLLGNISGSILFGHTEFYARSMTTSFSFGAPGTIVTTNTHSRDRYNPIVPNVQVQLGFGYRFDFNCDQDSIDIFAMWEGNYYWGGSNVFLFERGLGLNGLTTGIAYNW